MANPKPKEVLRSVRDLPTSGYLSQSSTGAIYLEVDDGYIFKALEVLRPYGYTRPPPPNGARIVIVHKREAEDNELQVGGLDIELGQKVDFKIVKAFPFYPRLRQHYNLKVKSPQLLRIRKHLTGRGKPRGGFFITVGVKSSLINQEYKEILDLDIIENPEEDFEDDEDSEKETFKQEKKFEAKKRKTKKKKVNKEHVKPFFTSSPLSYSAAESSSDEENLENEEETTSIHITHKQERKSKVKNKKIKNEKEYSEDVESSSLSSSSSPSESSSDKEELGNEEESTMIWTVMIMLFAVSIALTIKTINHSDQ